MEFIPYQSRKEMIGGDEYIVMQQEHHILQQRREELNLTQQEVVDRARILLKQEDVEVIPETSKMQVSVSQYIAVILELTFFSSPRFYLRFTFGAYFLYSRDF